MPVKLFLFNFSQAKSPKFRLFRFQLSTKFPNFCGNNQAFFRGRVGPVEKQMRGTWNMEKGYIIHHCQLKDFWRRHGQKKEFVFSFHFLYEAKGKTLFKKKHSWEFNKTDGKWKDGLTAHVLWLIFRKTIRTMLVFTI